MSVMPDGHGAQAGIRKVRDAKAQVSLMGVPQKFLGGHAFHTYKCALRALGLIQTINCEACTGGMKVSGPCICQANLM